MRIFRLSALVVTLLALTIFFNGFQSASAQTLTPEFKDWNDVLTQAKGQTLNWYIWGGSDTINGFVDNFYGKALKNEFGITLKRIPVADTVDAVNQVLSESKAGVRNTGGKVDLIWINGANFYTLYQAKLLYGPWAQGIPNSSLVAWDNTAVNLDFGRPVDGYESPWSSAQFHFIYDTVQT